MIDKLIIENYKSIQNIELELGNLNAFVGPNNAGKSNILDCLNFLAQFITKGAEAINLRGGYSNIVWNGEINRDITIMVVSAPYVYRLTIAGRLPSNYYIKKELLTKVQLVRIGEGPLTSRGEEEVILEFPVETATGALNLAIKEGEEKRMLPVGSSSDGPFISNMRHTQSCGKVVDSIKKWQFYNFVPQDMQMPQEVVKSLTLARRGENISQVLLSLHSEYPEEYERIKETLQLAIDEIKTIHTPLESNKTFIALQEKDTVVKIPAWAISDGTLRFLAHLCALYTPDKPKLVCLEEPENYIHPHLMEFLVNAFKNVMDSTQILITTHSPYLLNLFEPKDVIIVEKKRGATQIKYAKNKKGIKDALITLGLGELWYSGSLGGIPE